MNWFLTFCLGFSPIVYGKGLPSVLEDLEDSLVKSPTKNTINQPDVEQTVDLSNMTVSSQSTLQRQLNKLKDNLKNIEGELLHLAEISEKHKQQLQQNSDKAHMVQLSFQHPQSKQTAIKQIIVELDSHRIYQLHDEAGIWFQTGEAPLYFGPLDQGSHTLKVKIKGSQKESGEMSFNKSSYVFIEKAFELEIKAAKGTSSYQLAVKKDESGTNTLHLTQG